MMQELHRTKTRSVATDRTPPVPSTNTFTIIPQPAQCMHTARWRAGGAVVACSVIAATCRARAPEGAGTSSIREGNGMIGVDNPVLRHGCVEPPGCVISSSRTWVVYGLPDLTDTAPPACYA